MRPLVDQNFYSTPSNMAPHDCDSSIPSHWALASTDQIAQYMVSWFQSRLGQSIPIPQELHSHGLSLEGLCEAHWMVDRLVSAYHNKGSPTFRYFHSIDLFLCSDHS